MRAIRWLAILFVGLIVLLVIGGLMISPKFTVTRSTVINAPPDKVYPLVADPRGWKQWSVWNKRDPAMQIDYSGPPSGAGAKWTWRSKSEGDGSMVFTAAEPGKRVAYDLHLADFGTRSAGDLTFTPEGSGTRVTWAMNGDIGKNPLYHWFALGADRLMGPDFEAGLAGLKALAEKP
jgi:uncharacterized protein YndB with AHSA1/START domain